MSAAAVENAIAAQVAVTPFAIPYRQPLRLASGLVAEHCGVLVQIGSEDGCHGIGEIAPGPGTTRNDARAIARRIAAAAGLVRAAAESRQVQAPPALTAPEAAGVDTALADLAARRSAVPLWRLLADSDTESSPIAVNALIEPAAAAAMRQAAGRAIDAGYRCLKFKAGPAEFADCINALRYVRARYGAGIGLRLDGNGRWPVEAALAAMEELSPLDLEYFEQPVARIDELCALRAAAAVRIAADESAADAAGVDAVLAAGAADVIVLKPARLGPFGSLRAWRAARAAAIDCIVTTSLESSIGVAAALHVAAAVDAGATARRSSHGLGTIELLAGDILRHPIVPRHGCLRPVGPGIGAAVDAELLLRWRIDRS